MRCTFREFQALAGSGVTRAGASEAVAFLTGRPGSGPPSMPYRLEARWQDVLTALAGGSVYGFLRIIDPGADETRVLVAVERGTAVRIVVRGEEVAADQVRPDAPWPALTGALPEAQAAEGSEVTLPSRILAEARAEAAGRGDDQVDWLAYELRLREVPPDDARAVGALLRQSDQVTARIGIALCRSDGTLLRAPSEIEVLHSPTGRVAVVPEVPDDTYAMVTPASSFALGRALQHYTEVLWEQAEEIDRPA
ncbi:ESAT-6 protein secretion system EspG family protein [Saccharopolyspora erythraea NRRL 2338]|uniref:Uncharacterized protein n=2 Tax=Saccharopolyspora erythraea TaxID=1836 RepID=A4FB36_SACEN|nr:ESX secretion-associated protein EspG [Saccharopolyspora erythraea]EQD82956.1 secretion protein [Saccharopolyspora erythraea D]PFG95043.1 ESAT-6 protein secretion system EspG family protein [Saccharopolyspora erythraea NRRL 2338]QRK91732.1 ESX secretion-associated protein EspG [Saccharopolyspora erythraea]CAM01261.1 hypothetical protein SACE_1950 [Saccharopolyspora erythraea NRRL 2338]